MNTLFEHFQKLRALFGSLPTPQKIFYMGLLVVFFASMGLIAHVVNRVDYSPLYSRLSQEDLGSVVESLKAKKIPYQLSGDNGISVPSESLYETRLTLASEGVPKGSGVGFEIFDQQKLGSTEFVQKINYQRALQGELARTIDEMDEVLECRVHLVIQSESLFIEDQKPSSAAVVIKLQPGAKLKPQQVQGIVNLVASAVQGLKEDQVTIMSTDGQVLFKKNKEDSNFQLTNLQTNYKNDMEDDLRRKVQTMLEPIVGANRVLARVAVDSDFNQVQISEDRYDPDSAVIRSQQRSVENSQGGETGAKGNPDVPINAESQLMKSPPQAGQKTSNRQRETVNYEINHVTRKISQAPGTIKKISVAVILDGPYEMKANDKGKTTPVFTGYSADQLKSFEDIVKKAVGYDESRGDQITISNIAFNIESENADFVKGDNRWIKMVKDHQRIILNVILAALAFFFVIRPLMRRLHQLGDKLASLPMPPTKSSLPGLNEGEFPGLLEPGHENEITVRKKAIALVRQNPERATQILRSLLREEN